MRHEETEVEMVRVGKNQYMSREEAHSKGYSPRLDPPALKDEPILPPDWAVNAFVLFGTLFGTVFLHRWLMSLLP